MNRRARQKANTKSKDKVKRQNQKIREKQKGSKRVKKAKSKGGKNAREGEGNARVKSEERLNLGKSGKKTKFSDCLSRMMGNYHVRF